MTPQDKTAPKSQGPKAIEVCLLVEPRVRSRQAE